MAFRNGARKRNTAQDHGTFFAVIKTAEAGANMLLLEIAYLF
jgi:hypothetical protein